MCPWDEILATPLVEEEEQQQEEEDDDDDVEPFTNVGCNIP